MVYSIKVSIYQTDPSKGAFFRIVEKTGYIDSNGWDEIDGYHVFSENGSGTSGSLHLKSDTGESFVVTFGVHNYKRWGDIVAGIKPKHSACTINPEQKQREKQLTTYSVANAQGRKCSFEYTKIEGDNLEVRIVIG
ncbi:lectin [Lactarius quietus]|nr:lectin [Lactarius quietus]